MGFFALKLGHTAEQINQCRKPGCLVIVHGNKFPEWICDSVGKTTAEAETIMFGNDQLYGESREAYLQEIFATHGVQVRFT
jgi:hypothetical protein